MARVMSKLFRLAEFFLHIDKHLGAAITAYGGATYLMLFLIIFCETGLVVTPFLPGDSLIFAAGTFSAIGTLNVWVLWLVLLLAAIIGDATNYWIGHALGPKVFRREDHWLFRKEHLERTRRFYDKYGDKTIVLARFVPIVRTFAPFVAGVGGMKYSRFAVFNILGGFVWVTLFTFGGYFFGNLPVVRKNFGLVVIVIILLSFVPALVECYKHWREKVKSSSVS